MVSFAIIGAGSSGLAAAHVLQDAGHTVTLFESASAVGGRAATRRSAGYTYDHGAQYIKGGSPLSSALITGRFSLDDLVDIRKPVWVFDAQGRIAEGDSGQNAEPKWSYRRGLVSLAERMAEGLDVRLATRVERIERTAQQSWLVFNERGEQLGGYARLLISIPASQAAALVAASGLPADLHVLLGRARYNPLLSVMLAYAPAPQPRPYYALVNSDKAHAISWLAWEHEKAPERVPAGHGLLIAQMAPLYSQERWQTPAQELAHDVAQQVAALLSEPLAGPVFTDVQHWRYALPSARADAAALNRLSEPLGLAFCGDAFVGGRVHLALEHGCAVAGRLAAEA
jgi:renalase